MRSARILKRIGRPPVLVGVAFLAVTVAIVANALLLQSDRHPAPLFATRAEEGFGPMRSEISHPDALVQALQASLKEAGYYTGPVDGLAGPQTEAAIAAFERSQGRLATGRPDPELLAAIQSAQAAHSAPSDISGAPAPEGLPADADVATIQHALAKAAYGPLRADGVFGEQTRAAIARFQRDHGLPVTGEMSEALLVELKAAGALADD